MVAVGMGASAYVGSGTTAGIGVPAEQPALVVTSITPFGQDGPWAQAPGHDNGYEAAAGLLEQSGTPNQVTLPPVPLPTPPAWCSRPTTSSPPL